MPKFQFYILNDGDGKNTFASLKRIRSMEDEKWFSFPEEYQKLSHHELLVKLPAIKSALAVLKTRGQYRCVNVTLDDDLTTQYVDPDGNFIFKNHFLGETKLSTLAPSCSDSKLDDLVSCLTKVAEPKEESVKEILKHFLIEKFNPKNRNVEAWCEMFEKESGRFGLKGTKQIEVLKSCLDSTLNDWFAVNQHRFPISATWSEWKAKLISTFGDNSFRAIRYAYNFKFINGSLIDYAVRKEKMLLELDRDLSDLVILDLIVVGLPFHVQNSLNRHTVTSIEKLHNKLKKFESEEKNSDSLKKFKNFKSNSSSFTFVNSNKNSEESQNKDFKNKNAGSKQNFERKGSGSERKPCPICVSRGFSDRYHLESSCWFKDKPVTSSKSVNKLEAESSSLSSDDESKN